VDQIQQLNQFRNKIYITKEKIMNKSFKNHYKQKLMESLLNEAPQKFKFPGLGGQKPDFTIPHPSERPRRPHDAERGPGGTIDSDGGSYWMPRLSDLPAHQQQQLRRLGLVDNSRVRVLSDGSVVFKDLRGRLRYMKPDGTVSPHVLPKGVKIDGVTIGGAAGAAGLIIIGQDSYGNPIYFDPSNGSSHTVTPDTPNEGLPPAGPDQPHDPYYNPIGWQSQNDNPSM
jgi:hypothetical protein